MTGCAWPPDAAQASPEPGVAQTPSDDDEGALRAPTQNYGTYSPDNDSAFDGSGNFNAGSSWGRGYR